MGEVNYEYVKGQGWVPQTGLICEDYCGRKIRILKRLPKQGEIYFGPLPICTEADLIKHIKNSDVSRFFRLSYPPEDYFITLEIVE